ncbi:MAG: exopolyphosphatase, partial [Bdellovibrionales bacterium]|nr:exopolyphosphatase [Bdellovibrionales bacterium]
MRMGIIDLGTNSVRLFVYDVSTSRPPKKLFQSKAMVRLGDNLYKGLELDPLAIKRTVKALKNFKKTLSEFRVTSLRAVGTSALRTAQNANELISAVLQETGIALEPISGEEEARLIATGVLANEPCGSGRHLLIDIGGGSTEIIVVEDNAITSFHSLELG